MSEKDTEYQLTKKGKELAENLAKENIKKNELMETIVDKQINYEGNSESIKADIEKLKALDKEIKKIEQEKLNQVKEVKSEKKDDKMNYQKAERIRKKSFGALLSEQEGGLGESFKKALSLKTQAKVKGIKEKFDPMNIAKFLTFGSDFAPALLGKLTGRKQEDIARFTGGKTSTKLESLKSAENSEDGMNDILIKILNLLKSSNEAALKSMEKSNSLLEENKLEKEKRFKELLDALKGKKTSDKKEQAAEPIVPDTNISIFDIVTDILDAFGGAKTALRFLTSLGGFIASPLGVGLLAAVAAGTVGAWMVKQIAADPEAALRGEGGIGMAVAGLGSEGQLPSSEQEQKDKEQTKKAEAVDKKGLQNASLEELEAKRQQLIETGDTRVYVKKGTATPAEAAKAKLIDSIEEEIKRRKASPEGGETATTSAQKTSGAGETETAVTQKTSGASGTATSTAQPTTDAGAGVTATAMAQQKNPEEIPATTTSSASGTTSSPQPIPTVSGGEILNKAINENNNAKLMPTSAESTNMVSNNNNVSSTNSQENTKQILPVRNPEETFRKLISDSIRVV